MEDLIVLPSALKHGLSEQSLIEAWTNFVCKRPRGEDCWVSIGFDSSGLEIEMVSLVTVDGAVLIIHGLSPATQRIKRELGLVKQMAEYKLKSGTIVTDEDIERIANAIARGDLPGEWSGEAVVGRPRISNERLITVPVKFPESVVEQIDKKTNNRSDFIRKAVIACL